MIDYPFDGEEILRNSKKIRKKLINDGSSRIHKKIAVLGGSTTHDIIRITELFLLDQGIEPEFYESEYSQYWQDVMFDNPELISFKPDIIFIHTSNRNILEYPAISDSDKEIAEKEERVLRHFYDMWEKIYKTYHCPIIQNNFELPYFRLLGNMDASDIHGRVRYIRELNKKFADYTADHENFYINDIDYMSSCFGLDKWSDPAFWHMYKYCMCFSAIPEFAYNLSNIIKSIFGKNKKAIVLDLDNTLWGGIVGDDGAENIEVGQETALGQTFLEFQNYIRLQKDIGVLLNIDSKNDMENALAGLNRPDGALKPDDFMVIKANWDPKSINLSLIAKELNIGEDSLVFVDDNPVERDIIEQQVPLAAVPKMTTPEQYLKIIDRAGYFEITKLSEDDKNRNEMYKANIKRAQEQRSFADYSEFLRSLDMKAQIKAFAPMYYARIAQLTNKSNQFNLTTKRYTQSDIEKLADDDNCITLYGKLTDKYGDNGVVSVVAANIKGIELHINLMLMSCRVLKRDMEYAMMNELVTVAKKHCIEQMIGYYYKTAKNAMVKDFYALHGFTKVKEDGEDSVWALNVKDYVFKEHAIAVNIDDADE